MYKYEEYSHPKPPKVMDALLTSSFLPPVLAFSTSNPWYPIHMTTINIHYFPSSGAIGVHIGVHNDSHTSR